MVACSVDSKFSHLAWTEKARRDGGLGAMDIPLLSDITKKISRDYGVLLEDGDDAGVSLRGLFIIDPEGVLRQVTVNDLPIGRSVDESESLWFPVRHAHITRNKFLTMIRVTQPCV